MRYSKLQHDLEILELNHKHEIKLLSMRHQQERQALLSQCNHMYEDGSSARTSSGMQWDIYYNCEICGKSF